MARFLCKVYPLFQKESRNTHQVHLFLLTNALEKKLLADTRLRISLHDDGQSDNANALASTPSRRKGMKKKRGAHVHKLSEKRQRDKINKRLRVLQNLIPNCTKIGKASVLDEAIEYLKSLQLQLQIMSKISGGLCVPSTQMMLPAYCPAICGAIGWRLGVGAAGCSGVQLFSSPFVGYGSRH